MSDRESSNGSNGLEHVDERDIDEALMRMGELIDELDGVEDMVVRDKVFELLDWIDAFHREALVRVSALLDPEVLEGLQEDPVVARLFDAYSEEETEDPEDLADMLEEALNDVRPYLHSHGGEMEVLDVTDGVVKMRLMGSCDGCPSSTVTLTQMVEQTLKDRWPSFRKIEVEGQVEEAKPKNLLQIQSLRQK